VEGDDDDPDIAFPPRPAVKVATRQVRDLQTYGYQVQMGTEGVTDPQPNWDYARIIWPNAPGQFTHIGTFSVMNNGRNVRVLRIHEIWAGRDQRRNRAAFHDDVISFWRLTPLFRHLDYLCELRFDTVIEDTFCNLIDWIYSTMDVNPYVPLRVFRNGQQPNENLVFNTILTRVPFARRMQQAIDEYVEFSHRRIEGFYFTLGIPGADFAIYFDGYDPATIGDDTWTWE
jgi:hypothetical protein